MESGGVLQHRLLYGSGADGMGSFTKPVALSATLKTVAGLTILLGHSGETDQCSLQDNSIQILKPSLGRRLDAIGARWAYAAFKRQE